MAVSMGYAKASRPQDYVQTIVFVGVHDRMNTSILRTIVVKQADGHKVSILLSPLQLGRTSSLLSQHQDTGAGGRGSSHQGQIRYEYGDKL